MEKVLQARLRLLEGMKDEFASGDEYMLCRRQAIEAYGAMLKRAPTQGLAEYETVETGDGGGDVLAQLSAGAKRELGEAMLARMDDKGTAWKKRIAAVAEKVLKGREGVDVGEVVPDIVAAVAGDVEEAKSDLVEALSAVADTAEAKLKPRKQRGGKRKRDEDDEAPAAQQQQQQKQQQEQQYTAEAHAQAEQWRQWTLQQQAMQAATAAVSAAKEINTADDDQPAPPPRAKAAQPPPPPKRQKTETSPPPPPPKAAKPAKYDCDTCGNSAGAAGWCELCGTELRQS